MLMDYTEFITREMQGVFGTLLLMDVSKIATYYNFYDGLTQRWQIPKGLDYIPNQTITNYVKKLINEEARFMLGRTPDIKIVSKNKADSDACNEIQNYIDTVFKNNTFKDKLIKAGRDCFIGKRIAIKLWGGGPEVDEGIKVMFRMSLEFIYDTDPDDIDKLGRIVFFYQTNNEVDKGKQRIWKQVFRMDNGKCYVDEGIYDGYCCLIEEKYTNYDTGLDFIPAKVIVNDGLTGDLYGESDVEKLIDNQNSYNHMKSDDADALKFNMFPQKLAKNADEESLKNMVDAPSALVDLQPEDPEQPADMSVLESTFSYDARFEHSINRVVNDMYNMLNIPNVSLEQLQGLIQSGKSMKALYWGLICRCEEKWCAWEPALSWMVDSIIKLTSIYGYASLPEVDYDISIKHLYPLIEDDETERKQDLEEVKDLARSKRSYISKWSDEDPDTEYQKILEEKGMEQAVENEQFVPNNDNNT